MPEVILLSGGIESTTLLHREAARRALLPLFIDYGQRAAQQELSAARHQCELLGLELKALDMSRTGEGFREGQSKKLHVPLPHRNLVALSLALSYATQMEANGVLIALNREDTTAYPSASEAFLAQFHSLAATLGSIAIEAPLSHLLKSEIIRAGVEDRIDYSHTYSCLLGYTQHCGQCPQCRNRQGAFHDAGFDEPKGFYRNR
jgi:7-cyano-7-deazaguanine synthase